MTSDRKVLEVIGEAFIAFINQVNVRAGFSRTHPGVYKKCGLLINTAAEILITPTLHVDLQHEFMNMNYESSQIEKRMIFLAGNLVGL